MACREQKVKNKLMPELSTCDSTAIMYYHEPGQPKFFNMSKIYDKNTIAAIAENVNDKLITGNDSCISQGKIYGYGKGDAVYVVYFSKQAGCMTLSFIKSGDKYFVQMNDAVKKILDDLEKTATEPKSQN
jgi:hypothetical protein